MKIVFFTLALDAMPWITLHWPELKKLTVPWDWWVMEGVAENIGCTSWCNQLAPRLSNDGTTGYLKAISAVDPRVRIAQQSVWRGKQEMVNYPLRYITEPCLLWQVDADECWTASQIEIMAKMFEAQPEKNSAFFRCNYFVGPNLKITSSNTYGNNESYEWLRVWRVNPGVKFAKHEPPVLENFKLNPFRHDETEAAGLRFSHYAYASEAQVRFKQEYYGRESGYYKNAVEEWKKLQVAPGKRFRLQEYLSWIKDEAIAEHV